MLQSNFLN